MNEYIIDEEELISLLTDHFMFQAMQFDGEDYDYSLLTDYCEANGVDCLEDLIQIALDNYYTKY